MPISQHHIDELKEIYGKETGVVLSDREAWEMAIGLINLFRLVLKDRHNSFSQNDRDRSKMNPLILKDYE